jgi:UDP-N-acetylmuramoyl-tripeptide--D-alanyl-D-alanine ligase
MLDIFFDSLTYVLIVSSSFFFLYHRSLRYLRYLQQEDYTAKRFIRWFLQNRAFDTRGTTVALTACAFIWLMGYNLLISALDAVALAAFAMMEGDPRQQGKVRLNMTERATRIFRLSIGLSSVALLAAAWVPTSIPLLWLILIIIFQLTPLSLLAANALLQAEEQRRQQQFVDEAKAIFSQVSPYTIGITGSYGKTSTKDALAQLLQITAGPTFWPPKGINTFMGNTREIRSHLKPGHRYAIFEMGAYGRGSIKKLCSLTPPHAAIITIIGTAHLERFGSEENILLAKSELAEAVPFDGILVCNGDNAGARSIATTHQKKTTLLYGFNRTLGHLDCWISSFSIEPIPIVSQELILGGAKAPGL